MRPPAQHPHRLSLLAIGLALTTAFVTALKADQPRSAVGAGLKDLDGHFPMQVPETLDQWKARALDLGLQVKVALALHPQPTLSIAEPTIHGRRKMAGYTIEKIYFESLPGFYVTGSLYRPTEITAPKDGFPAVLYAHGHWENGRFYEASPNEVRQLLATGAERFEHAAINQLQAACVQLARMGCVVLQYDMIGYADSGQISFDRAHRFGINIDNPVGLPNEWLLYSAKAEGYGQSIMALQAINSLRAFEVMRSMPEVDGSRIAITGASGGGTQSFITAAVEPRLAGAFPAVMVSTGMQGGCTCENACGLRVGTGNVEIVSLAAPRPIAMTTARDWTLTMPEDGFPQLKKLYGLFGKESSVQLFPGPQFPHNYNHVSRVAMYGFMNQLFGLGLAEPILESDFELLRADQLTVWNDAHPRPASGVEFERKLTAQWADMINQSLVERLSDSNEMKDEKSNHVLSGWKAITMPAIALSKSFDVAIANDKVSLREDNKTVFAASSMTRTTPSSAKSSSAIDLVLLPSEYKLSPTTGEPLVGDAIQAVLDKRAEPNVNDVYVCSLVDPLGGNREHQPLVSNPRPAAPFTYGYNAPRIVRKLAVLTRLIEETSRKQGKPVRLVVSPDDVFLAAAAALQLNATNDGPIQQVIVAGSREATAGKFSKVDSIVHNDFLPGSLRYQDVEGLLSVIDPTLIVFE